MVPSHQPEPQAHCNLSASPDARHSPGSGYLQQEQHWCSPLSHISCVPSGRGHRKIRAFPRVTCGSEVSIKDFGWLKSPVYSAQLSTLLWVPVWQQCLMQTAKNNYPFYTEGETEAQQHSQTCFAGLQLSVQLSSSLTALLWLNNSTVIPGSQKTLLQSVVWQETGKKSTRMLILTCSCGVHQQWVREPPCWLPSRPWRAMHVCTSCWSREESKFGRLRKAQGSATEKDLSTTYTRRATWRGDTSRPLQTVDSFLLWDHHTLGQAPVPSPSMAAPHYQAVGCPGGPSLVAVSLAHCSGLEIRVYSHPLGTAGTAPVGRPSLWAADVTNASKRTTSDTVTLQL